MSTNVYLAECSHSNAQIKKPGCNTFFTNKIGDGIRVNEGDQISVHSAYIHEIGSGSQSIEFDGESVGTQSVTFTEDVSNRTIPAEQNLVSTANVNSGSVTFDIRTVYDDLNPLPVYYGSQIYTSDSTGGADPNSIEKADNVTITNTTSKFVEGIVVQSITISKATNKILELDTEVIVVNTWLALNPTQYQQSVLSDYNYTMTDSLVNVEYSYYKNTDGKNCMILPRLYFANQPFPADAFVRYSSGNPDTGLPLNDEQQDSAPYLSLYRRGHDNSRYKIFTMVDTVPSVIPVHTPLPTNPALLSGAKQLDINRDIALRDFVQYHDKLEFSVPSGYNTPSNIAQDLTSQMHASSELNTISKSVPNKTQTKTLDIDLSVVIPSPTFKQFQCSCVSTYNKTTYTACTTAESNSNTNYYSAAHYLQAYKNIGVYDPELFVSGRKLKKEGYVVRKTIAEVDRASAEVVISHEYTADNLLLWKNFFSAQAKRTDLIFNSQKTLTPTNTRFIHMNPDNMKQVLLAGVPDPDNFLFMRLGDDGLRVNPKYNTPGSEFHLKTGQSSRQFINYQEENADTFLNESDTTDNNLCYGFAKCTTVQETDYYNGNTLVTKPVKYITFLTNTVGGLQTGIKLPITCGPLPPTGAGSDGSTFAYNVLQYQQKQMIDGLYQSDIRYCGFDHHFSAYGTDSIILWSGYVREGPVRKFKQANNSAKNEADYTNITTDKTTQNNEPNITGDADIYQTYAFVDWISLGADDPLINFSDTGSRFTISQLHTCPRQGNLPLAGRDDIADFTQTFPDNPHSGNLVYSINPVINRGNNSSGQFSFNPEVLQLPYFDMGDLNLITSTASICKQWTVFDSQTGISFESFGCDENSWEKSIWYKMGFEFSQLNSKIYDIQSRSSDGKAFPVTTNAQLNSTQMLSLMVNAYDGSQYTLQSPIAALSNESPNTYAQFLYPVMTEIQTSTLLTAARKPSKQIFGYYLIRSNIIDNSQFFSEGVMLPVVSVVSKNYTGADFVFSDSNSDSFTVTKSGVISSVTTGIYKPNGELARADEHSAVIYKIVKRMNFNPNIAAEILNKK